MGIVNLTTLNGFDFILLFERGICSLSAVLSKKLSAPGNYLLRHDLIESGLWSR